MLKKAVITELEVLQILSRKACGKQWDWKGWKGWMWMTKIRDKLGKDNRAEKVSLQTWHEKAVTSETQSNQTFITEFLNLFICVFLFVLSSLRVWAFSSRSELGLLSGCGVWVSRAGGFSCGAQALGTWALAAALWHVESSQTRDQTCVPCIGRPILIHWTTREVQDWVFYF